MAKNTSETSRIGAVKGRSQVQNPAQHGTTRSPGVLTTGGRLDVASTHAHRRHHR